MSDPNRLAQLKVRKPAPESQEHTEKGSQRASTNHQETSGLQCLRNEAREELHINFGNSTRLARIDKEHFALDSDYEFFRAAPLNYSRPFPSLAQPGPTNWLGLPRIHVRG